MTGKLNHNLYFQELEQIVNMDSPSSYPKGNARVARFLHERFAEMGTTVNTGVVSGGGSDGNFSAALGIPTIDGLGPRSGRAHSPDEYMEIDSVEPHFRLLREIIRRM